MLPAKRLWLWHQAKDSVQKAEQKLRRLKAELQSNREKVSTLEAQLATQTDPASEDEQIARLLLEQELWMAKKAAQRAEEELQQEKFALEQTIEQHRFELLKLEQDISEAFLQEYHRIAENKANPIVEVKNKSCMGCFMPLSLSKVDEWRRGKGLVYCDECGRILV